jgi:hypothetical protein
MKTVILAALALVSLSRPADARPRQVAHHLYLPECNVSMPCEGVAKPAAQTLAARMSQREVRRRARGQALYDAMLFGMPTDRAGRAIPAAQVLAHPAGCPRVRRCGRGIWPANPSSMARRELAALSTSCTSAGNGGCTSTPRLCHQARSRRRASAGL